ncbi:MAG: helix-turn-helix domain-containing protein [Blautia sp.]|jgi:transcriptional regulator with XRE-family HTH domain
MTFSKVLRELRLSRNVTQDELAKYLNVSRPTIAGYETKNKQPDYEKLLKLAEFFNVSVDYLITGNHTYNIPAFQKRSPQKAEEELKQSLNTAFQKLSYNSQLDLIEYAKLLYIRDRTREIKE